MNLMDLKVMVDDMVDSVGGEENAEYVDVKFASQPAWPMEYSVDSEMVLSEDKQNVYLLEHEQIGYLPGIIKERIGW